MVTLFLWSNTLYSSLVKSLQFQTKVTGLFGLHWLLFPMCIYSFNAVNFYLMILNICALLYHRRISSECAGWFHSHVQKDKLFRIESGCGKPVGDGLDFFQPVISSFLPRVGVAKPNILVLHWFLRVEVESSEISLARLPAIYTVLEASTALSSKQGEAVCRHSSFPTGIFTHLGYFQLGKVFVLSFF